MVKRVIVLLGVAALLFLLSACETALDSLSTIQDQAQTNSGGPESTINVITTADYSSPKSAAEAAAANGPTHENRDDYNRSGAATEILLDHDTITVAGRGVEVDGRTATITSAGTYSLSGTLEEGQILVNSQGRENVQLILNGVELSNSSTAPLYIVNAPETIIFLAENTVNRITDGEIYQFPSSGTDEPNAAVFSHDNLTIYGPGALIVAGSFNDGIAAKDGLIIAGGDITIDAADDGIRGKRYLIVKDGRLAITAQGDGLKADEKDDPTKGYIAVDGGEITISSSGDALQAQTDILITGGAFNLTAGGGSANAGASGSARGMRAESTINIDGGTIHIDAADDAINSSDNFVMNDGTLRLASGDDGLHADANLEIHGGAVEITRSVEGIESTLITINDGQLNIIADNDGINVAGGSKDAGPKSTGDPDTFVEYTGDHWLIINGGTIAINAAGDGIDSNGAVVMTDGLVIVNGPADDKNGALDYDGTFTMAGGFIVAAGSSAMARTADASSTQNALLIYLDEPQPAGSLIHIADENGRSLLTFAPAKAYQSIAFSSPDLSSGATYTIYSGGSASGTAEHGLYLNGTYNPGTELERFKVSKTVTIIGSPPRNN